jgi:hypothetical protein
MTINFFMLRREIQLGLNENKLGQRVSAQVNFLTVIGSYAKSSRAEYACEAAYTPMRTRYHS